MNWYIQLYEITNIHVIYTIQGLLLDMMMLKVMMMLTVNGHTMMMNNNVMMA